MQWAYIRKTREFVRDLCKKGRTDEEVIAVTRNSCWETEEKEVKDWLTRRGERWRKMGRRK